MASATAAAAPAPGPSAFPLALELSHVRYFIDSSVAKGVKSKLEELLQICAAQPCRRRQPATSSTSSDDSLQGPASSFDLEDVTHIITSSPTYSGFQAVEKYNSRVTKVADDAGRQAGTAPLKLGQRGEVIAVVTPKWFTRSYDLRKRQEEQFYSPDPRQIFSGVVVCTEDLPAGDSETIKGIVAALGGQWRQALVVEVTHLVCTKPYGRKFERLMISGYKLGMRAILPHWFDDCIKLQQCLAENDYLWPEPPCLASKLEKPKPYIERLQEFLNLAEPPRLNGVTASLLDTRADQQITAKYLESINAEKATVAQEDPCSVKVLAGKRIYIAESCELGKDGLGVYQSGIKQAGGKLLASVTPRSRLEALQKADYVIVNHRQGWEFWKAFELNKTIGNLDWLIYVLFTASKPDVAVLPSPMDRLLHYPWPKKPISDFESYTMTVSGYAGPAREAIKRMIELLGGKFEGTMTKNKTTHVISSAMQGSKVQHAQLWNVPVINHFWIEDCFLSWSVRSTAISQYHNFELGPKDFSFASLVGTRPLSPQIVEEWAKRSEIQRERKQSLQELTDTLEVSERRATDNSVSPSDTCTPLPSLCQVAKPVTVQESIILPEPSETDTKAGKRYAIDASELPAMDVGDTYMAPVETETLQEDDPTPPRVATTNGRKSSKRKSPEASSSATPEQKLQVPNALLEPPSSASTTVEVAPSRKPAPKKKRSSIAELQQLDQSFSSTPQGYSRRKAAAAATQKLHDTVMPDVLLYQEELKGKGKKRLDDMFGSPGPDSARLKPSSAGSTAKRQRRAGSALSSAGSGNESTGNDSMSDVPGTAAGRGGASRARKNQNGPMGPGKHVRIEEPAFAKGRIAAMRQEEEPGRSQISSDYSSFDAPPGKKHHPVLATSKILEAGGTIKVATTGIELNSGMRKALTRQGAQLLGSDLTGVTHMIAKNISRTVKFLQGISMGVYFVTEQWAIDSVNQAQFLDEDRYLLKDAEGEKKHNMSLALSVKKARSRKVFDEQTLYLSPKVQPEYETLKAIAEAAGAKVIKKIPTVKVMQDQADAYVIASADEKGSWLNLMKNGIPVHTGEAIIKGALQQEMRFAEHVMTMDDEDD